MLLNCVVMGSGKDVRRCGRDSGNTLEVGDAMQSVVLSLIVLGDTNALMPR